MSDSFLQIEVTTSVVVLHGVGIHLPYINTVLVFLYSDLSGIFGSEKMVPSTCKESKRERERERDGCVALFIPICICIFSEIILRKRQTVKHNCILTPNLVAAELSLLIMQPFTCFKSDVLFDCFGLKNNYNDNR